MNKAILVGNLTRDPETRYTKNKNGEDMAIARFTIAVNIPKKKDESAFISCVAFGKTGEVIEKYTRKGSKVGIVGHIQTGSYEKDGVKHYTTDIIVEEVEFLSKSEGQQKQEQKPDADGFMSIPDGLDAELPFN